MVLPEFQGAFCLCPESFLSRSSLCFCVSREAALRVARPPPTMCSGHSHPSPLAAPPRALRVLHASEYPSLCFFGRGLLRWAFSCFFSWPVLWVSQAKSTPSQSLPLDGCTIRLCFIEFPVVPSDECFHCHCLRLSSRD